VGSSKIKEGTQLMEVEENSDGEQDADQMQALAQKYQGSAKLLADPLSALDKLGSILQFRVGKVKFVGK
jgi:hypothetical protein